jgi:abequosyltransferase
MVTKRAAWDRVPFNEDFDRSCWAHAARFFELMKSGLTLRYVAEPWQDRRGDNDSFLGRGLVARIALSVDGYHRIADTFFGHDSVEAFHVRRVIRKEFGLGMLMMAKYACSLDPVTESKTQLDGIVRKAYSDFSLANLRMKIDYRFIPAKKFEIWQPKLAAGQVEIAEKRKAAREART